MKNKDYFIGLDIGTDSVGYAVTDEEYNLLKYKGKPMWGSHLFEEARLNDERRGFRTGRRRLERRKQRVKLVQEQFAEEIGKLDPMFFRRVQESSLWREDAREPYAIFNDAGYTDKEYHQQYPTIHHLIVDLMNSREPRDVRLVYLACAWLVAHRGHFLNAISKENIAGLTDFETVWKDLEAYILNQDPSCVLPWRTADYSQLADLLRKKLSVTVKTKALSSMLFETGKAPKTSGGFPYGVEALIKLLCGAKVAPKDLFIESENYSELSSFSLGSKDEELEELFSKIGDDADLIIRLKAIYDWGILVNTLNGQKTISEAKVQVYEQHEKDLRNLKAFIRKYHPGKYNEIFRETRDDNYQAYVYHSGRESNPLPKGKAKKDEFCLYLKKIVEKTDVAEEDREFFEDMMTRLSLNSFLPKQVDGDNRVIPYQLYWFELKEILSHAAGYLPFLDQKDQDGFTTAEKLLAIFEFRIPYFVGPLNKRSERSWVERKPEKIYPWNFDKVVDLDASENEFIRNMLNTCTYLPSETVLPKESLLYHRFTVLNEINNIKIDGTPISAEAKQAIYENVFLKYRKPNIKRLTDYMLSNNIMQKGQSLTGIDEQLKSDLKPYFDFHTFMVAGVLNEEQIEDIIEHITCTEDKPRLKRWLAAKYPALSGQDIDYIARINYKDFGRLSRKLLAELEGCDKTTGEVTTIIRAMWENNLNLMELLSDQFTFNENIKAEQTDFRALHPMKLDERLNDMWISNAVKRPIIQALKITREVVKAVGAPPKKIFVEVTRGATPEQKNKRTKSRKDQILELYTKFKNEDVRILEEQLSGLGAEADNMLRSDAYFLYFMQMGKCMYTGKPIDLAQIKSNLYNIDHIYPQSYITDDSPLNNKVLVYSENNGQKSNEYPIAADVRHQMHDFWTMLQHNGMISDEKYHRLTRSTPFTDDEKMDFINRQLTQTSQSVKAVAELLKEYYADTEIVYTKARLTSEFRQEFDLLKSRVFNDLHHAKDAYLNIVTGNVYNMRFSKQWFSLDQEYSVKTKTIFTHPVKCGGKVVWDGEPMLAKAKKIVSLNNAHMTCYSFVRKGGLFDQMPVKAAENLVPRKQNLPTAKYGGYNRPGVSFFLPVKYKAGKKSDIIIMAVQQINASELFMSNEKTLEYAKTRIYQILGKPVDEVSLPLGMRLLKINTMIEVDGFRACISGSGSAGKCLIFMPFMPFTGDTQTQNYLKRLESLVEKVKKAPNYVFNEKFDKVTVEQNLQLYDLYIQKFRDTILRKRNNNPLNILLNGREKFKNLSAMDQAKTLINIHGCFGRVTTGNDMTAIGGAGRAAATVGFSAQVSSWKKTYTDVRIIDSSVSGIWESKSDNLLNLL